MGVLLYELLMRILAQSDRNYRTPKNLGQKSKRNRTPTNLISMGVLFYKLLIYARKYLGVPVSGITGNYRTPTNLEQKSKRNETPTDLVFMLSLIHI